jgi:hypothetical protein
VITKKYKGGTWKDVKEGSKKEADVEIMVMVGKIDVIKVEMCKLH